MKIRNQNHDFTWEFADLECGDVFIPESEPTRVLIKVHTGYDVPCDAIYLDNGEGTTFDCNDKVQYFEDAEVVLS